MQPSRIEHWKRIFDTDDNSISKALSHLTWDLAVFTCVVEMVHSAPDEGSGKRLNGTVMELLVSGFWNNTMQGIRRIADRGSIHGPMGVCSLGGLIIDAKAVRHQLTRQVFVEDIAGLEYDVEAVEQRYWDYIRAQPQGHGIFMPRELDSDRSRMRHEVFDWLSGADPASRSPQDLIRLTVFDSLEARLAQLNGVVEHAHVEIAHAATEFSRNGRRLQKWDLADAKEAIRTLAHVAQLTGEWFCYSGIGTVLPHPQFDQFAYLDQPLFTGDTATLQEIWRGLEHEISNWHDIDPRTL